MRNRVVHEGYQASRQEALEALRIVQDICEALKDSLFREWSVYPKTLLVMLGSEGLTKRDLWKGDVRDYSEKATPDMAGWITEFVAWSRKVRTWR